MLSTKVAAGLNALVARLPESAGKYVALTFRLVRAIAVGNISDRAMTLAGQAFTSILPVILMLTTLPGVGLVRRTLSMFDFSAEWGPTSTPGTYASFGILGALMTLISATSLARALERMYVGVWSVRSTGLRGWWRWLTVLAVLAVTTVAQAALIALADDSIAALVMSTLASFVLWTLAWTAVPRALTGRQLTRADLWWLGTVGGAGVTAFIAGTELGYSAVFVSARHSFGALGVVFASIGWLFVFAAIIVVATILVQVARTPPESAAAPVGEEAGQLSG